MLSAGSGSHHRCAVSLSQWNARSLHTSTCRLGGEAQGQAGGRDRAPRGPHRSSRSDGERRSQAAYLLASLSNAYHRRLHRDADTRRQAQIRPPCQRLSRDSSGRMESPQTCALRRVTIAQLLSHRAGFSSADDGDDAATGTNLRAYLERHSARGCALAGLVDKRIQDEARSRSGQAVRLLERRLSRPWRRHRRGDRPVL